jgi:hypothetical protein
MRAVAAGVVLRVHANAIRIREISENLIQGLTFNRVQGEKERAKASHRYFCSAPQHLPVIDTLLGLGRRPDGRAGDDAEAS